MKKHQCDHFSEMGFHKDIKELLITFISNNQRVLEKSRNQGVSKINHSAFSHLNNFGFEVLLDLNYPSIEGTPRSKKQGNICIHGVSKEGQHALDSSGINSVSAQSICIYGRGLYVRKFTIFHHCKLRIYQCEYWQVDLSSSQDPLFAHIFVEKKDASLCSDYRGLNILWEFDYKSHIFQRL